MFCTMRSNWKTSVVDFRVNINKGLVCFRNLQSPAITQNLRPIHSLNRFSKSSNAFLRMQSNGWRNWTAIIKNTSTEREVDGKMIQNVVYYNFRKTVSIEYVREDVIDNGRALWCYSCWLIYFRMQAMNWQCRQKLLYRGGITCYVQIEISQQYTISIFADLIKRDLSSSLNSCKLLLGGR